MNRHNSILTFILLALMPLIGFAQVTIGAGVEPQRAALLDLRNIYNIGTDNVSANKGLLLPRVALIRMDSLEPFITNANEEQKREHIGLIVYNMNTVEPFMAGVYVWHGENWELSTMFAPVEIEAGSGIYQTGEALGLGDVIEFDTKIDLLEFNLNIETDSDGALIVNPSANALVISGENTQIGIRTVPQADANITARGNALITDSLIVEGLSSLQQTIITDTLFIQHTAAGIDNRRHILQSDAAGNAAWVPLSNIPGYEATQQFVEANVTQATILTQADWNRNARVNVPGFELRLSPGVWLIYFSVVIEPIDANGQPLPATDAQIPVWARFNFHLRNQNGLYSEPSPTAPVLRNIGALEVSDKVFGTVRENIIHGQLVVQILGTQTATLHLTTNSRTNTGNYRWWNHTSPTGWNNNVRVRIGYPGNPMNYAVAFPM